MGLDYNVADVLQDLAEHLIGNGIVVDPLLRSSKVEANRQGPERLQNARYNFQRVSQAG
jgi:hypothetical protein